MFSTWMRLSFFSTPVKTLFLHQKEQNEYVGSLVPVENDKKGVTLAVTASSLLSSELLPPFIIDTGSFGTDLMISWSNYKNSTVICYIG